jgi:hypothetical protein
VHEPPHLGFVRAYPIRSRFVTSRHGAAGIFAESTRNSPATALRLAAPGDRALARQLRSSGRKPSPTRAVKFDGHHEYEIEFAIAAEDKPAALRFLRKLFAGTELQQMQE